MEEKSASNSKNTESEVSPDKANSGSVLESKRKRKPNSFIFGNDFDTSPSEVEPRGVANNLSQTRPQWRQQWRRAPPPSPIPPSPIPQNPVLPTTAPKVTNSASKTAQTASKVAPKTASIQQNPGKAQVLPVLPTMAPMQPKATKTAQTASNVASKTNTVNINSSESKNIASSGNTTKEFCTTFCFAFTLGLLALPFSAKSPQLNIAGSDLFF